MKITEERLRANGWETVDWRGFEYVHFFQKDWFFKVDFYDNPARVYLDAVYLPNVRTMEQLALLFVLLGDKSTIDDLTIPPALREDVVDRRIEREFGRE